MKAFAITIRIITKIALISSLFVFAAPYGCASDGYILGYQILEDLSDGGRAISGFGSAANAAEWALFLVGLFYFAPILLNTFVGLIFPKRNIVWLVISEIFLCVSALLLWLNIISIDSSPKYSLGGGLIYEFVVTLVGILSSIMVVVLYRTMGIGEKGYYWKEKGIMNNQESYQQHQNESYYQGGREHEENY